MWPRNPDPWRQAARMAGLPLHLHPARKDHTMTTEYPALHRLRGAMGADDQGRTLIPAHRWLNGRCGHCGNRRGKR